MSGSTGTPMNLNTFDGTDDVVKALTDLFNQNMNLINSGDIHTKVWKPNTAYQKNDILVHPYHNSLIYALSSHTSSNSTTEADWSTNDGAKWRNLSYAPIIANWMANMNYNVGDLLMDGLELKQATTAGATATLDRTTSAFVGSRIANWTPNTKYNVGDLVCVKSVNMQSGMQNAGRFINAIFIAKTAHTSGTQFPASADGMWDVTNIESYYRSAAIVYGYGRYLNVERMGNILKMGYMATGGTQTTPKGNTILREKLPSWADPTINGEDNAFYVSQAPWYGNSSEWMLSIHSNASGGTALITTYAIPASTVLRGNGTGMTDVAPEWEAGVPVQ